MTYLHQAFDAMDLQHAKDIVLGRKDEATFDAETHWLIDRIMDSVPMNEVHTVLDFGCGMGRVSRVLSQRTSCSVIGVDPSDSMRQLAQHYVASDRFRAVPAYLQPGSIDLCVACLVLQHVENPHCAIRNIALNLKDDGMLVVVNEHGRLVPVGITDSRHVIWHDDGADVFAMLRDYFDLLSTESYFGSNPRLDFYRLRSS